MKIGQIMKNMINAHSEISNKEILIMLYLFQKIENYNHIYINFKKIIYMLTGY